MNPAPQHTEAVAFPDPPAGQRSTPKPRQIGERSGNPSAAAVAPDDTGLGRRTAFALATHHSEQIVDVLSGRRGLRQVRALLANPVAALLAKITGRTAEGPDYRLRSVHACSTSARRVEACAIVDTATRVRALALRLERRETRWFCTALTML